MNKPRRPFGFSFSAVTGLWGLSFSSGEVGELTGALWWEVRPELKELRQVPRPCSRYFYHGPLVEGLLSVSKHPSLSFILLFNFLRVYILCFLLPCYFSKLEEHRTDIRVSNGAVIRMDQGHFFKWTCSHTTRPLKVY